MVQVFECQCDDMSESEYFLEGSHSNGNGVHDEEDCTFDSFVRDVSSRPKKVKSDPRKGT